MDAVKVAGGQDIHQYAFMQKICTKCDDSNRQYAKYLRKGPLKYSAYASINVMQIVWHKILVHFKYLIKTNKIGIDH